MRIVAIAVLLSGVVLGFASRSVAADSKADPSQYTLAAHVSASEFYSPSDWSQEILTVTIGSEHYRVAGVTANHGLLAPGDYHARLSLDQHKTSFESFQQLEFLFPDGTTRRFYVIAQSQ